MPRSLIYILSSIWSLLGGHRTTPGTQLIIFLILLALMAGSYFLGRRMIYVRTVNDKLKEDYGTEAKVVNEARKQARMAWIGPPLIFVLFYALFQVIQ